MPLLTPIRLGVIPFIIARTSLVYCDPCARLKSLHLSNMPYVRVPSTSRAELAAAAEERWTTLLETKPDLKPAIELQRRLLALVMDLKQTIDGAPFPRLSLPGK